MLRHRLLPLAFLIAAPIVGKAQVPRNMVEEDAKLHRPAVTKYTSAAERLAAWEKRQQMQELSPFGQLKWRNVGPTSQGGRIIRITSPASNPKQLYVAFATGGLWRTEDDGITWTPLFDNESAYALGDVAITKDGKTLYVGTGENNAQRTSYSGTGVFKSTDAGKTWKNIGLPESHRIGKIAIDPKNENTVYVAVTGSLYSQNPERGLYKTTNGGTSWTRILNINEYTGVIDVALDPSNPNVVYASAWERDRRSWNFRDGGPGSALYKSTDAGKTWAKLTNGLPPTGNLGRIGIAISPVKPKTVYAYVDNQGSDPLDDQNDERIAGGTLTLKRFLQMSEEAVSKLDPKVLDPFWGRYFPSEFSREDAQKKLASKEMTWNDLRDQMQRRNPNVFVAPTGTDELYRSDDAGKTWRRTHRDRIGGYAGYYWGKVYVNPRDAEDVIVCGVPLLRSRDGGKTFTEIAESNHVDHHAIWWDRENPDKFWNGNDGGLYVSGDDGDTWRHINNLAVGQITTIAVDNKTPYNIYVGMQDNGTMRGPSTFRGDGGFSLFRGPQWTVIGGGDGSHIAVDPRGDGDIVYVASQFGAHSAIDQKNNTRWGARASSGRRYNWVSPLIISPHHPDIIYLGSEKVHRSFNQGRRYEDLSDDLSKNRPAGNVPHSSAKDLSESPLKFGLLYVGYDDGNVLMTPNGGADWVKIPTPEPEKWVSRIVASRHDLATVYCSQSGYREDDFKAYLWKSTDYGKTWTSIVGDLPHETINVVREDPTNKDILYVGTDLGVWVTFNGGQNWESLHGGLPTAPIHDLVIQEREKDLVIGTHSRSAWILPLRQVYALTKEVREKDLTLFPVEAVRYQANLPLRRGNPYGYEEPTAPAFRGQIFAKKAGKGIIRLKKKGSNDLVLEKELVAGTGFNDISLPLVLQAGKGGTTVAKSGKGLSAEDALKDPYASERPIYVPAGDYDLEVELNGAKVTQEVKVTTT